MNDTDLVARLCRHQKALAKVWQQAVAHTSYTPFTSRDLRERFRALTEQVIALLVAETFDRASAQTIGADLARLHYVHPEALARTQEVFSAHLPACLTEAQRMAVQPRLAAILSAIAAGFVARTHQTILAEQETIRAAAIKAREEAEQARHESEARFQAVFSEAAIGMGVGDMEGRILAINRAAATMFGYSQDEFLGMRVTDFTHPDDATIDWKLYQELIAGKRDYFCIEKRYYRKDGQIIWTHLTVSLVRDAHGQPRFQIAMMEDITARKALEERLARLAFYDSLTGLPNRGLFLDRLGQALERQERSGRRLALLFLDLDGFKVVNDSLGHQIGDHLLVAVAQRLQDCVRGSDTVARLGGDEFTILLEDLGDDEQATGTAERIIEAFTAPYMIGEQQVTISASLGVVIGSPRQSSPTDLLRDADTTMYRAKEQGKGRYAIFHPSLNARAVARFTLEADLRRAIDTGELLLHYQPIVRLADDQLISLEALLRWRHPARGLLSPHEFIAVAEETGLIVPIGQWVLEEACLQTRRWQERYPDLAFTTSVNFSAVQFGSPRLTADIAATLTKTGLEPARLQLELTESTVMEARESHLASLRALTDLGVRLAIDDFGTGHSSLSHLKRLRCLPIHALKLDQGFVAGLGDDAVDQAIVQAVVTLAHTLGLVVIGEGVELATQVSSLRALGCDYGQGFYFGQAGPASEIDQALARHSPPHPLLKPNAFSDRSIGAEHYSSP